MRHGTRLGLIRLCLYSPPATRLHTRREDTDNSSLVTNGKHNMTKHLRNTHTFTLTHLYINTHHTNGDGEQRASFYRHLKKLANVGPAGKGQQLIPLACFICLTYPSSSSSSSHSSVFLSLNTLFLYLCLSCYLLFSSLSPLPPLLALTLSCPPSHPSLMNK